jgi:very-short-patch-repair endonuclease
VSKGKYIRTNKTLQKMRLAKLGKKHSEEHNRNISLSHIGKKSPHSEETKTKISLGHIGKKLTPEHREKIGFKNRGKKLSEDTKKKLRVSALERVLKDGQFMSIGKHEIELLNKQEILDNCKIIRQFLINPLGYCVDGYCPETNTVYEVYEKWHQRNTEKDSIRQTIIQDYLKCEFVIIWDIQLT